MILGVGTVIRGAAVAAGEGEGVVAVEVALVLLIPRRTCLWVTRSCGTREGLGLVQGARRGRGVGVEVRVAGQILMSWKKGSGTRRRALGGEGQGTEALGVGTRKWAEAEGEELEGGGEEGDPAPLLAGMPTGQVRACLCVCGRGGPRAYGVAF